MKKRSITSTIVALILISANSLFGQSSANDPLPAMFVPKTYAQQYAREFWKNKFLRRSKYTRIKNENVLRIKESSFIYTWDAMNTLLNTKIQTSDVRIYFARFTPTKDNPAFQKLDNGTIIILFSPEVKAAEKHTYFFINTEDDTPHEINEPDAIAWIKDFNSMNQPILTRTIRKRDAGNYCDINSKKGVLSDTRSIIYSRANMLEAFIEEKKHQSSMGGLDAFQVELSAFPRKGKVNTADDYHLYRRRLFVQFEYMKKNPNNNNKLEVFYLDDQPDFHDRSCSCLAKHSHLAGKDCESLSNKERLSLLLKGLDNGQLCPTNCPEGEN